MKLVNPYGTPGFLFQQYNNRAELMLVVALRETFEIDEENGLGLVLPRPPLSFTDTFDNRGQLIDPADFIPHKPGTDVTVLAQAHSPSGKPESSWTVAISVGNREKRLRVHGPRFWRPDPGGGWTMDVADPVASLPLTYTNAFGGPIPRAPEPRDDIETPQDRHRFNPAGPGLLHPEHSPRDRPIPAPRIEAEDTPITDWRADYTPQGFAPITPVWRFRQQYCGTYDQTWLDTRHPFLPLDFDYRFYNCAHPDLVFEPHLVGGETVELLNLHPVHKRLRFTLPRLAVLAEARQADGTETRRRFAFDGVHIDMRPEKPVARLTWRLAFPWPQGGIDLVTLRPDARVTEEMGREPEALPPEDVSSQETSPS
jgi:hypothetical protein